MTKVDMKYIDYLYTNKTIQNTRKSPAGDLFRELADVLGANTTLLKEDRDPSKRYCFDEDSVDLILAMLEMAKSSGGKRLRCWDYEEAGALTVHFFINAFNRLYRANGASECEIKDATLQMIAQTDFVTVIAGIAPELYAEVESYLFAPNERFPNAEDSMNAADQYVFLSYLSDNPEADAGDVLREYWFFQEACTFRDRQKGIPLIQATLQKQTDEEREQYKANILKHIRLDDALDNDDAVIEAIHRLEEITGGKGKLGDKKEIRAIIDGLIERVDYHAEQVELPLSNPNPKQVKRKRTPSDINTEMVGSSYELLRSSIAHCAELKEHRLNNPGDADNLTILEMCFQDRFGFPMF